MNALALEPNSFLNKDRLIYILILLERYDEALIYLDQIDTKKIRKGQRALRFSKNSYAYLYFKMGNYQKALFYNDKCWFHYKNSFTQLCLRGQILHHVGRYNESIDCMLQSINIWSS
jgi:tetratricopeptide (TPR) repeat protein